MDRRALKLLVPVALVLVLLAGGGFAALESDTVANYWQGLWWSLGLVTTVGFVNQAPTTGAGQALSAILMVAGFGLLTLATASVASLFVSEAEEPDRGREISFERQALAEIRGLSERLAAIEQRLDSLEGGTDQAPARGEPSSD